MTYLDDLLRELLRMNGRTPAPAGPLAPPQGGDNSRGLLSFPTPTGLAPTQTPPPALPDRNTDWSGAQGQYAANDEGIIPGRVKQVMSPRGQGMLREPGREGPFREFAYLDPARNPTIGFGHKIRPEDEQYLRAHQGPMDRRMGDALFTQDLQTAEDAVRRNLRNPNELSQNQFDALVSLVFNIGAGAFARSRLPTQLNARDYAAAGDEFLQFNRAGGRARGGLNDRRRLERNLFLNGVYPP